MLRYSSKHIRNKLKTFCIFPRLSYNLLTHNLEWTHTFTNTHIDKRIHSHAEIDLMRCQ